MVFAICKWHFVIFCEVYSVDALISSLFDRDGIYRRPDRFGDGQRRGAEKEFVNFVLRAIRGQIFQVENFAHADADHGDHHPVPRLRGDGRFVGPDFAAPGIRADRGHVRAPDPLGGFKSQARSVAAGVVPP